jgi:hypothetical protein
VRCEAANSTAQAAFAQADVSAESLTTLRQQLEEQSIARRETALEVLEELARNALSWKQRLSAEHSGSVQLFPNNWRDLMIFVATQAPYLTKEIRQFEQECAETGNTLNAYMQKHKAGRIQITPQERTIKEGLYRVAAEAKMIADLLRKSKEPIEKEGSMHAPPSRGESCLFCKLRWLMLASEMSEAVTFGRESRIPNPAKLVALLRRLRHLQARAAQ